MTSYSAKSELILADVRQSLGLSFTPRIYEYLAHNEQMLDNFWQNAKSNLLKGTLPRMLKDMIFVVVANCRSCAYCVTAHSAFCKMMGLDHEELDLLITDVSTLEPESTRLVLQFATNLVRDEEAYRGVDRTTLIDAGLQEAQADEVVQMVGFACNITVLVKGFGLDQHPDQEFTDILSD